jgi:hypothetical protein
VRLELQPQEVAHPRGLEIAVAGFPGHPLDAKSGQVFIEIYDGKLLIYVWTGETSAPTATMEVLPINGAVLEHATPVANVYQNGFYREDRCQLAPIGQIWLSLAASFPLDKGIGKHPGADGLVSLK